MKMSKYTYIVEEWSTDTRKYRVESDKKLLLDEVIEVVGEAEVNEEYVHAEVDEIYSGKIKAEVTFAGTRIGNDIQWDIIAGREDLADES
jgi:hypothetical protein